ncbi:hypothetical protein EYC80_004874 [Monilinia laxa]|uniref:Uncharacterized protein n=1 Tax=Monilinia laxa TaxID=61186 RepID=A0A5N6KIL7_MONLA|nr:hypothetical protein EYC80_004874 [Monilinia laxa]
MLKQPSLIHTHSICNIHVHSSTQSSTTITTTTPHHFTSQPWHHRRAGGAKHAQALDLMKHYPQRVLNLISLRLPSFLPCSRYLRPSCKNSNPSLKTQRDIKSNRLKSISKEKKGKQGSKMHVRNPQPLKH